MLTLYVMCGVPGSGKTTRSKQMAEEHGLTRISYDELRCRHQSEFIRPAVAALRDGKDTIMDSTNLRISERKNILQAVADIPCKKVVVFMDTSLQECMYRNAHREARLLNIVVEGMYRIMQKPTLAEGWDEIIVI